MNSLILLSAVYLWIPEHSMQSSTPRLMEAQQGAAWPQSQHSSFPGRLCTLWRRLSPPPRTPLSALSPLSLGSLAESMLLVEGEAVRSKRCRDRWTGQRLWGDPGPISNKKKITLVCYCALYVYACVCAYLNIIIVGDVFVSRGDACLDRLDPSLPQLLRLGLQHTAPTGL